MSSISVAPGDRAIVAIYRYSNIREKAFALFLMNMDRSRSFDFIRYFDATDSRKLSTILSFSFGFLLVQLKSECKSDKIASFCIVILHRQIHC
mmetsp:Transcript_20989/g.49735  ORF Transcript_20989/g.49735 Transcript_20989/m.49735 type:complete len:93 (-) Transcript_20989:343-621(-)